MSIFRPRIFRSPLNPDFIKYQQAMQQRDKSQNLMTSGGYIPPPLKLSHLSGKKLFLKERVMALPYSYDLRKEKKLTPVKDQESAGTCWAFATYGSMESCQLPTLNLDFSENNMKNLLSENCPGGFDRSFDGGGNQYMSTAYLSRWDGPVLEKDDPYQPGQVDCKHYFPVKHIRKVIYIPDRRSFTDNTNLKLAIKNYGAVFSSMYFDNSYFHEKNASYYNNQGFWPNHAICLVGWDDNYSRNKFKAPPPGDGAFIVRNSWGREWGDKGYFYVSYYDQLIGRSNALYCRSEAALKRDMIYQYDALGWIASFGFKKTSAWFANIYQATDNQYLKACGFYAASPESTFSLYVYKGVKPSVPQSGQLVKSLDGWIDEACYFVKSFSESIYIGKGQFFSLVVKLNTPDWYYPVPAQIPIPGYSSKSTSQPGQGFISPNGKTWYDIYGEVADSSICLKAMAQLK